jgi:hypothetical protein
VCYGFGGVSAMLADGAVLDLEAVEVLLQLDVASNQAEGQGGPRPGECSRALEEIEG